MKTLLLVGFSVLACLGTAYAAPGTPDRGESKDNIVFEGQSHGILAEAGRGIYRGVKEIVDAIAQLGIMEDGIVNVGMSGLKFDGSSTKWNMEIGIESRVWGRQEEDHDAVTPKYYVSYNSECLFKEEHYGGFDYGKLYATKEEAEAARQHDPDHGPVCSGTFTDMTPGLMAIPFELRLRANLDDGNVDVKDLKVGAFRWIFKDIGLTTQILSYVMKKYDGDIGIQHGAELLSLTFSDIVVSSKRGNFEVIFKARAGYGFGALRTQNAKMKDLAATLGDTMPTHGVGQQFTTSGSVTVRIAKRILVEGFAGYNYSNTDNTWESSLPGEEHKTKELTLRNRTWGASVQAIVSKNVRVGYTAQWDRYDMNFDIAGYTQDQEVDDGAGGVTVVHGTPYSGSANDRKYGVSHFVNLEVRW